MDDNINNIPPVTPEDASQPLEGEWKEVSSASAEEWSKEIPAEPVPPAAPAAADDPGRWSGELYTPGAETPQEVPPAAPAESVVVDIPPAGTSAGAAAPEKKKFPVWAIVLIVILVLLLCCVCPILIWASILSSNYFTHTLGLLLLI